jgi:hypothetical protein
MLQIMCPIKGIVCQWWDIAGKCKSESCPPPKIAVVTTTSSGERWEEVREGY